MIHLLCPAKYSVKFNKKMSFRKKRLDRNSQERNLSKNIEKKKTHSTIPLDKYNASVPI